MGLDPGYKNGVKCAVVDDTGKLLDTVIVYLHQENNMLATLSRLIKQHGVRLIAIGNGTASRETDKIAGELVRNAGNGAAQNRRFRSRRVDLFRVPNWRRASSPTWTFPCAARCPSPAGCKTRSPSWSKSTPNPSAWGSISTT
ncbi:hypothetical protein [Neisseria subflava]|uniref:hypothetical protein n=1 Tax=Neisseria subflava TaxID=28449 RepID=UPI003D80AD57